MDRKLLCLVAWALFLAFSGATLAAAGAGGGQTGQRWYEAQMKTCDVVEAFSFRTAKLKEGVTPEAFEAFCKGLESVEGVIPGVKFVQLKGDRGVHKGTYLIVWEFDSVKVRDFYFPVENGESLWSAWMTASDGLLRRQSLQANRYLDTTTMAYTDYVAVKSTKDPKRVRIAKGDPATRAFAFRPLTLKEGVKPEAFERFAREFPSLEGLIPGIQFLLLRGDRGVDKGKYAMLWVYDSVKVRDFYFPNEDGENPLWQAWVEASDGLLQRLMEEASPYLEPSTPGTDGDVTDYVGIQ